MPMNTTINTDQNINNISGGSGANNISAGSGANNTSGGSIPPSKVDVGSVSAKSAGGERHNMGIIEEEESLDFSSSVRSLF